MFDGFPAEDSEAVLLEKHLSGLDLEAERRLLDGRSRLAPPPLHLLPDINRPLESSLDVVFLLNVLNENQLLERAMERARSCAVTQKGKNNKTKNSKTDSTQPGSTNDEVRQIAESDSWIRCCVFLSRWMTLQSELNLVGVPSRRMPPA